MGDDIRAKLLRSFMMKIRAKPQNEGQESVEPEELIKRLVQEEIQKNAPKPEQVKPDEAASLPPKSEDSYVPEMFQSMLKMMNYTVDNSMSEKSALEEEKAKRLAEEARRLEAEKNAEELRQKIAELEKKHETAEVAVAQKKLDIIEKENSQKDEEKMMEETISQFIELSLKRLSEQNQAGPTNKKDPLWFPDAAGGGSTSMNNMNSEKVMNKGEVMGMPCPPPYQPGNLASAPNYPPQYTPNYPNFPVQGIHPQEYYRPPPPPPYTPDYRPYPGQPDQNNLHPQQFQPNFRQGPQQVNFVRAPKNKKQNNWQQQQHNGQQNYQQKFGQNQQQQNFQQPRPAKNPQNQPGKNKQQNGPGPSNCDPTINLSPEDLSNVKRQINKNSNQAKAGKPNFKPNKDAKNQASGSGYPQPQGKPNDLGAKKKVPQGNQNSTNPQNQQKKNNNNEGGEKKNISKPYTKNSFPTYDDVKCGKLTLNQPVKNLIMSALTPEGEIFEVPKTIQDLLLFQKFHANAKLIVREG